MENNGLQQTPKLQECRKTAIDSLPTQSKEPYPALSRPHEHNLYFLYFRPKTIASLPRSTLSGQTELSQFMLVSDLMSKAKPHWMD